jgi:hypothetical protein
MMTLPPVDALRRALDDYPAVVERQGVARLADLDRWYRTEFPTLLAARAPAWFGLAELVRLTEWKMARGVWRAPNLALVRSNEADAVEQASRDALAKIPHPTAPIAGLAQLRGVGPATASAAAAAAAPGIYPFFDELVAAQLPALGPVAWTMRYYARYAEALRDAAKVLGGTWTPAMVAQALWAHSGGKAGVAGARQ